MVFGAPIPSCGMPCRAELCANVRWGVSSENEPRFGRKRRPARAEGGRPALVCAAGQNRSVSALGSRGPRRGRQGRGEPVSRPHGGSCRQADLARVVKAAPILRGSEVTASKVIN